MGADVAGDDAAQQEDEADDALDGELEVGRRDVDIRRVGAHHEAERDDGVAARQEQAQQAAKDGDGEGDGLVRGHGGTASGKALLENTGGTPVPRQCFSVVRRSNSSARRLVRARRSNRAMAERSWLNNFWPV